jgi:hypothetical protein
MSVYKGVLLGVTQSKLQGLKFDMCTRYSSSGHRVIYGWRKINIIKLKINSAIWVFHLVVQMKIHLAKSEHISLELKVGIEKE